jgi:hypothetical protein
MIFFCGSVYFGQQVQKTMFIFFQSRSLAEPLATSRGTLGFRGTPVEKPCLRPSKHYLDCFYQTNKASVLIAICQRMYLFSAAMQFMRSHRNRNKTLILSQLQKKTLTKLRRHGSATLQGEMHGWHIDQALTCVSVTDSKWKRTGEVYPPCYLKHYALSDTVTTYDMSYRHIEFKILPVF